MPWTSALGYWEIVTLAKATPVINRGTESEKPAALRLLVDN